MSLKYMSKILYFKFQLINMKNNMMQIINHKFGVLLFLYLLPVFLFGPVLFLKAQPVNQQTAKLEAHAGKKGQVHKLMGSSSDVTSLGRRHATKIKEHKKDLEGSHVLVYTKNGEGYVHKNIPNSIEAIQELGKKHGFMVDTSDDPSDITEKNLKKYDALIFSNTNNDVFNTEKQHKAFQDYIRSGGNFVGIHSASGSERDWPWFWSLLGGSFHRHAPFQEFTVKVTDKTHPSTSFLKDQWVREDECYYLKQLNPNTHVLLHADMTTVEDEEKDEYPGDVFGDKFPLAWYHEFEGGRSWYTALGHSIEDYDDPVFLKHILGGIKWAVSGSTPK